MPCYDVLVSKSTKNLISRFTKVIKRFFFRGCKNTKNKTPLTKSASGNLWSRLKIWVKMQRDGIFDRSTMAHNKKYFWLIMRVF